MGSPIAPTKTLPPLWRRLQLPLWRRWPYSSPARAVVVGGCGRSGTTLMRVILDTHPNLCCGPESELFLPRWPSSARLATRFGLDEPEVRTSLVQSRAQAEFIDRFFARYCRLRGRTRWAEKTPRNVLHLSYIFDRFPQARFIHMVRDGRDTVCSLRTHPRFKLVDGRLVPRNTRRPLERCIRRWVTEVRAGLEFRHDPRYLEVRYEDLVQRPRETLETVFAFLDEPFDERVLSFHQASGSSRDVQNFPQNWEATQPLYTRALSRWQTDLSREEIDTFKRMAGPLLVELGYVSDERW